MKLQQISSNDVLTQQVVNAMISRSTALEFAEFYSMTGNAEYRRKAATASGGQFRALDSDYSDNAVSPDYANPALKILGDKVQVDRAHERRGMDVASERARQLLSFAQNLGKQFQNYFFNGDSTTPEQFDGLIKLVPVSQKLTPDDPISVVLGNTNTAKTSQQAFLEAINQLIQKVDGGAQVLFMNSYVLSRLTTVAREFIQWQPNTFGTLIPFYNGIPLRDAGYDKDGNMILPQTETLGDANDCSSIFAVRFGEAVDLSIATNIGVEVKDLGLVGSHYTHTVEFDAAPVLLNNKAVAQLSGIEILSVIPEPEPEPEP